MRVHVHLEDDLVAQLDREVGQRGRSAFIEQTLRAELARRARWHRIWEALDAPPMEEEGHPWDPDAAAYFHDQRMRESFERTARLDRALPR